MVAPKFSELFHAGKIADLFYVAKRSAKLIFWTTVPILLGLLVLGKSLLVSVFGPEFALAYPSLVCLVLGQAVNSISGSTGHFMNMTGHQSNLRNIMMIAAVNNVVLNLILIPFVGIFGAALAAMASVSLWNVWTLIFIKRKYGETTGYFPVPWFVLGSR
jgi:O-antigen/teichoic acid export membrane protein